MPLWNNIFFVFLQSSINRLTIMARRRKKRFFSFVLFVAIGTYLAFTAYEDKSKSDLRASDSPTQATQYHSLELPQITNPAVKQQIVAHTGYTVSFNPQWNIPNWVAYDLTAEETAGVSPRAKHFEPDPDIRNCPTTDDYKNSGFDRGHMAPAGDMKWDEQAMRESFYMSNICPQNHNLNNGDWKILEEHVRTLAARYDKIYIACGPLLSGNPQTIGTTRKIAVPDAFFKVLLCCKNNTWHAIGFIFSNQAGHKKLSTYCMTIDQVEELSGIDFFHNLQDDIESEVEATFNLKEWGINIL